MKGQEGAFTSGAWYVKPGKEKEFVAAWKAFADWTLKNAHGVTEAYLLQDQDDSRSFVSFGPWRDEEAVQEWRKKPQFKVHLAKFKLLCDDIQVRTMRPVAHPSKR